MFFELIQTLLLFTWFLTHIPVIEDTSVLLSIFTCYF